MRTLTPLVALTLSALTGTAGAQETTPAAATASATTEPAATASVEPPPATATAVEPPAEAVAATPASPPAASPKKIEIGLAFLPMGLGKFTYSPGGKPKSVDAGFAYGGSFTASYEILPGLLVGIAPQMVFNVGEKGTPAAKQYDLMARVAYAYRPGEAITVYAEVLPGYSIIAPPVGLQAKGFVLAVGAGAAIDLGDRYFVNIGMGYQIGFQNRPENNLTLQTRTKYMRVALGGGVRF